MADNENSVPPEQIEFLKWLEDNRFSQFRENFCRNKINTLQRLCLLKSEEQLARIGIDSFGDQLDLLDCISKLRALQNATEAVGQGLPKSNPAKQKQSTLNFGQTSKPKTTPDTKVRKPYDEYMYRNPKWPKTKFFNEITPKLYDNYGKFLSAHQQASYIRKEREARWQRLQTFEKFSGKFNAMFNSEYSGGYFNFLDKPAIPRLTHVDHCEKGICNTKRLKDEIEKEITESKGLLGNLQGQKKYERTNFQLSKPFAEPQVAR
jgi:hypothetical protein